MNDRPPFLVGLTGSIGAGKTTTAQMFTDLGIPVWDADAAVHRLYATGGAAVRALEIIHPGAITKGAVDRAVLKGWIARDATALRQIEQVVHPLVARDRRKFIETADDNIVVLDIPLLFETGAGAGVDLIAVVTVPADIQRHRVLKRSGMTPEHFESIVSRQMPDAEKRIRADVIIPTLTLEGAQRIVQKLVREIRRQHGDA